MRRFLILLGLVVAAFAGWQFVLFPILASRTVSLPQPVSFEIRQGENLAAITARLEQAGVVDSAWVLKKYLTSSSLDRGVQAGQFSFAGELSAREVAERLQKGGSSQIAVTILEGWESGEIDAKLLELGLIGQAGEFATFVREGGAAQPAWAEPRPVASLEGYLFPSTYFVDPARFSVESFADRMLEAMQDKLAEAGWNPANSTRSLHQVLTMASIVEAEERDPAAMPLVADILWRRLDAGWQIGADATLFYALGHKEHLTAADLAIDSPYNTRRFAGLPPTPIGSPGLAAIRATLQPQANEYWYYLHAPDGQIYFARDNAGHEANKARYLR